MSAKKLTKTTNGETTGIANPAMENIELDEPNLVDRESSFPEKMMSPEEKASQDDNSSVGKNSLVLPAVTVPAGYETRSPVQRVRVLLSQRTKEDEKEDEEEVDFSEHSLFTQMDVLCHYENNEVAWKEAARWVKFEEKLEAGDRWSKPHVSTTSLHALLEISRGIADGSGLVLLDMNASHGCMHQVAENIANCAAQQKSLTDKQRQELVNVLMRPHKHKHRTLKKKKTDSATVNLSTDGREDETKTGKFKQMFTKKDGTTGPNTYPHTIYPGGFDIENFTPHKPNKRLMKKVSEGTEAANILVGEVDFLDEPLMVLCRLDKSAVLGDLTEINIPTRFIFIMLGPKSETAMWEYVERGRAVAAYFSDKVFAEVAYLANCNRELVDGMEEFMDDLKVLPPSIWDPSTRLQPPDKTMTMDKIKNRLSESARRGIGEEGYHMQGGGYEEDEALTRTGRLFGGLVRDIKKRGSYYLTDIRDGLHPQCLASVVFLYFACITPIVTFGGLLGSATHGYMGTMETLVSGAMCGIIYHLFSGQPLTIVGATGPLLVFESMLYKFSKENDFDFLSFRFWIGMWISLILLIMVAFDLSSLVKYITRFTEESFSVLISLIFMVEAFTKVVKIWETHPVEINPPEDLDLCHCLPGNATATETPDTENFTYVPPDIFNSSLWSSSDFQYKDCITYTGRIRVDADCLTSAECTAQGWTLAGDCGREDFVPDVFFLSCFLFIGTFTIAYFLRTFRNSPFFASIVRNTAGDFAVLAAILICTGIDAALGLDTPKLLVPSEFKTTRPDRGWLVNPFDLFPKWWLIPVASVPAILATILIFLDQQITAVIVNRKAHKLKKPPGYHLDLMVLSVLIALCSTLGLPWFVAATVRSVTHVRTLFKESEMRAPGEKAQFLGVREQRVTGLTIHILIGVSVLLTSILKYIPMAVLFGVFLYMGVTSLAGVQFADRILILLMPQKHQPDHMYLRHVDTKRVHLFTVIQIFCMVGMWAVKSIKKISLLFPIMVMMLCFVRKGMDWYFTQNEMYWLDHLLPETPKKKKMKEIDELNALDDVPKGDEWNQIMMNRDYPVGGANRTRRMSLEVIQRGKHRKESADHLSAPTITEEEDGKPRVRM